MKALLPITLTVILFACSESKKDYFSIVKKMQNDRQSCLDQGRDMLGCDERYLVQMDSMLNVVYKDLRNKLDEKASNKLLQEERMWIKSKEVMVLSTYSDINELQAKGEMVGELDRMMAVSTEADFIHDRLMKLIVMNDAIKD